MKNKEKNFISAVVYVHNDENQIKNFLDTLITTLENNFNHSEIVCVNDSSTDDSVKIIKEMSSNVKNTTISILNMSCFHGLEIAMNAGVDLAIGDFVYEFDTAVMDFDSEDIMNCYRRSLEGYDIVSSSPNKKQRVSSSFFYYIIYKLTNIRLVSETFRILSRRAINRIKDINKFTPYRKIIYFSCGLKKDNIIYEVKNNDFKTNKEQKYRKKLAIDSLILFTNAGYKFAEFMTIIMMMVVAFMAIYSVVVYITGNPIQGWTTTVLFMSVAFFGMFAILTIIIKYLQLLVDLVFKRKNYSFESIEKLTK